MYFDSYYILLVILPMILGIWAQAKVSSTFKKYQQHRTSIGYTGAQIARRILDDNGLRHIRVEMTRGRLTDHYDPRAKAVRLSESVYNSMSISAVGVAAHECGHAVQDAKNYLPMKIRSAIIPVTNFGSKLAVPLILIGIIFSIPQLTLIGLFGYLFIALFQLVTLPVEFNASARALATVNHMGASPEDKKGIRKVLSAAALTYVAALISAVTQFLFLLIRYSGRRR